MRKTLIYCNFIGGHQLEYMHHLYEGALAYSDREYVFAVPEDFHKVSGHLSWPTASNVVFDELEERDIPPKGCGFAKSSYINCRSLRRQIKKHQPSEVVLISLIEYLPFLPFLISSKVKVRGILYRVYLYDWKKENWKKKAFDVIKYLLMTKYGVFDKVYILNDGIAAKYLNKLYGTDKFEYLTDPISSLSKYKACNVQKELDIAEDSVVYLHPGGMLRRKGTLEIMKAIELLSPEECKKLVLIFAGRVSDEIKDEFENLLRRIEAKVKVVIVSGFLPFEKLADLFESCNYVLIPYTDNSKSSGIVGHAAYYKRPAIVAKGGIIGKLVRNWQLGYLLDKADAENIAEFLRMPQKKWRHNDSYIKDHTISNFYTTIYR